MPGRKMTRPSVLVMAEMEERVLFNESTGYGCIHRPTDCWHSGWRLLCEVMAGQVGESCRKVGKFVERRGEQFLIFGC